MRGFTIFFAMLVSAMALSVGLAIYDLTVREVDLSATATQSQYAVYAADAAVECALYWDYKCTLGSCREGSAFATSTAYGGAPTGSSLTCSGIDISAVGTPPAAYAPPPTGWTSWAVTTSAASATTTFTVTFAPQPYCATVTVSKYGTPTRTMIVGHGFNKCSPGGLQLERVLQVIY